MYSFDFSTFSQTPHHISISVSFSLVTIDLTLFPSLHFTRWMKQWSSLFLFEIFFNIFWQCLLDFFKKNEQIRTGCCLQCMLGQDTNHHPSATSNVWLALTAKGQRDSHVSSFCLTKTLTRLTTLSTFHHFVLGTGRGDPSLWNLMGDDETWPWIALVSHDWVQRDRTRRALLQY